MSRPRQANKADLREGGELAKTSWTLAPSTWHNGALMSKTNGARVESENETEWFRSYFFLAGNMQLPKSQVPAPLDCSCLASHLEAAGRAAAVEGLLAPFSCMGAGGS